MNWIYDTVMYYMYGTTDSTRMSYVEVEDPLPDVKQQNQVGGVKVVIKDYQNVRLKDELEEYFTKKNLGS